MRNAGEKEFGFGRKSRKRFVATGAEILFDDVNSAFDKDAMSVKIIPMVGAAGDTGVKAQIFMRVNVSTFI